MDVNVPRRALNEVSSGTSLLGRICLERTSMDVFDGAGIIGSTSAGKKLPGGFSVFPFPIFASRLADACRPGP